MTLWPYFIIVCFVFSKTFPIKGDVRFSDLTSIRHEIMLLSPLPLCLSNVIIPVSLARTEDRLINMSENVDLNRRTLSNITRDPPNGTSSSSEGSVIVTAREMSECHRSQTRLLYRAVQKGNVTVSGDGNEFMDVTGELTCDVIVMAPEKHVVHVHLLHWEYDCDYYFSDLFLVFDSNTGPMNSLLPYQLCITQGSQVYSFTHNVTLRFVWEPTGRPFRFVVTFQAVPEAGPRTFATFTTPGYSSHSATATQDVPGRTVRPGEPVRLRGGLWNCSATPVSLLLAAFPCNLRVDCVGGEDEALCPYTSPSHCPALGTIFAGGSCFQFVKPQAHRTWEEAEGECEERGGHLAVLNSREEWSELYRLFFKAQHTKDFNLMAIGIRIASTSVPPLYRQLYQWVDNTIAYDIPTAGKPGLDKCGFVFLAGGFFYRDYHFILMFRSCHTQRTDYFLCELPPHKLSQQKRVNTDPPPSESSKLLMPVPANFSVRISTVRCPSGHLTHEFLACDVKAMCFSSSNTRRAFSCSAPLTPRPPMFTCANQMERVPFALVCDHRADCVDDSDENFCTFSPCDQMVEEQCGNRECKPRTLWCDFSADCVSEADERQCRNYEDIRMGIPTLPPPALVHFKMVDKSSKVVNIIFSPLQTKGQDIVRGQLCPETHFQCPGNGYCVPVFLRCNGVLDCPGHQDEDGCSDYTCPGLFRCRSSKVCVHAQVHICDGQAQCPHRDDEAMCDFRCPQDSVCYWNSFTCVKPTRLGAYSDLRYLDATGTGMNLFDVANNAMLIYLKLDSCHLTSLESPLLPNLQSLVLSKNNLANIMGAHLKNLSSVRYLDISRNPLLPTFLSDLTWPTPFTNLKVLNFSGIRIPQLTSDDLFLFQDVEELHLESCGIERIDRDGFQVLQKLRILNLQGSVIRQFPPRMLKGLNALHRVEADIYKLCCPVVLPEGFNYANCFAPQDEISSCGDLLRFESYMVLLSVFAALSLVCNSASLLYRVFVEKAKAKQGFAVFVTHLCAADILMGLYLAIIGVVDRRYRGSYLWNDEFWKNSAVCKLTGFLSLLSNEVSAFIICLITLDRFLVLRFPFSDFHFRRLSGHIACGIVWILGLILVSIPLFPAFEHWKFYSQTGICIPLPITRKNFPGQSYSFAVMVILNFVLFILIVMGQGIIFWSIRTGSMSVMDTSKKSKDLAIARRLISIAMSDFLCWFPIGILGLMASRGRAISGEVNMAIAIIVLPINSVLNPFLYTLNIIMEIRQRAREQRQQKNLLLKIQHDADCDERRSPKGSANHERLVPRGHSQGEVTGFGSDVPEHGEKCSNRTGLRSKTAMHDFGQRGTSEVDMKDGSGTFQNREVSSEKEAWFLLTAWFNSGLLTQSDILSSVTGSQRA